MKRIMTLVLFLLLTPAASLADETVDEGKCDCAVHEVDFGVRRVDCTENGMLSARWVCEYSYEYRCRLEGGNEIRSGGFIPSSEDLCKHLCFPRNKISNHLK